MILVFGQQLRDEVLGVLHFALEPPDHVILPRAELKYNRWVIELAELKV